MSANKISEGASLPPDDPADLTVFMCGPSKCDHDYHSPAAGWVEYQNSGGSWTGTAVCSKCGAHAVDEAYWSDF